MAGIPYHNKLSARFYFAIHAVLNNYFGHVKADSGALILGGEAGLENIRQNIGRNAACVIAHDNAGTLADTGDSNVDNAIYCIIDDQCVLALLRINETPLSAKNPL